MQEAHITSHRWLLPCQRQPGPALEVALGLADAGRATLIVVSLVTAPRIPYTHDLSLDVLRARAQRFAVPLECCEEYTHQAFGRIAAMTCEWHCDGLPLGSSVEHALFLSDDELRALLTWPPTSLVLVRHPLNGTLWSGYSKRETSTLAQGAGPAGRWLADDRSPPMYAAIPQAESVTRME